MSYNNGDLNGAEACISDARNHVNLAIESLRQALNEEEFNTIFTLINDAISDLEDV